MILRRGSTRIEEIVGEQPDIPTVDEAEMQMRWIGALPTGWRVVRVTAASP